jgi:hypothetical protein
MGFNMVEERRAVTNFRNDYFRFGCFDSLKKIMIV